MIKKTLIIAIIFSAFFFQVHAQMQVLLNSGEQFSVSQVEIDEGRDLLFYKDRSAKVKWVDLQDVFSYMREDSVHIIFYKPDCEDVCFKTHQMYEYLSGYAAGGNEFTAAAFVSGFVVGSGFSLFFVRTGLTILVPLPPAANSMLFGGIRPKGKNFETLTDFDDNPHYTEGYLQRIKRKRTLYSILGGAAGVLSGGTAGILMK